MNKAFLLGRLTKDPEVRYTPSGKVVAQFTIAVDRPYTNPDGTRDADFFPIVIWGKSAETAGNSLTKGQRVLVEGRVQIRSYEKEGVKRWVTEVIADRFEFIERRDQWDRNRDANRQAVPAAEQQMEQPQHQVVTPYGQGGVAGGMGTGFSSNTMSAAMGTSIGGGNGMGTSMGSFGTAVPDEEKIPF